MMYDALCMCICAKKTTFLGKDDLNHSRVGGGIHGEDALSKLSHTATVCAAVFLIDPNPNRFVGPKMFVACCLVRFATFFIGPNSFCVQCCFGPKFFLAQDVN